MEVYKNRTAEAWKTRGQNVGVPGAEAAVEKEATKSAGGDRNAKRREAKRRAKAAEGEMDKVNGGSSTAEADQENDLKEKEGELSNGTGTADQAADPAAEKEKQVRGLKKKLRQARELREKKDQGQNLLPEQFEKVIKINELIRQLDNLGFDAEGEPKG